MNCESGFVFSGVGLLSGLVPTRNIIGGAAASTSGLPGQGRGLTLSERLPRNLKAADEATARDDLFCLVKHEMSDEGLSQEPLLVWPAAFYQQSRHFLETANTTRTLVSPEFDAERKSDLEKIMVTLKRDFPSLNRAAAWYKSLIDRKEGDNLGPYTHLSFLRNVADERLSIHDFQFAPPRPVLLPHRLEVVFHRR